MHATLVTPFVCYLQELSVMRQVVVGLMSGQGREGRADRLQGGGAERLQGGGACSTPDAAKPQHPQDMPTPTVFVSAFSILHLHTIYTCLCINAHHVPTMMLLSFCALFTWL